MSSCHHCILGTSVHQSMLPCRTWQGQPLQQKGLCNGCASFRASFRGPPGRSARAPGAVPPEAGPGAEKGRERLRRVPRCGVLVFKRELRTRFQWWSRLLCQTAVPHASKAPPVRPSVFATLCYGANVPKCSTTRPCLDKCCNSSLGIGMAKQAARHRSS